VQPALGRISNSSDQIQLEPRAMDLLVYLAETAGEVVSRRQILDGVWQQEFVDDVTLSSSIARLRKALDDDARNPRYIETLSKRGYRMLPRPVDMLEVASRPGGAFRIGDWLVEPSLNRMSRGDSTVQLEQSTMDVLLCLAERAGEPVPRHELVDRVWRTESVPELTVSRRIAELQEALGDSAHNPGYIETVPEGGYRLAAAVAIAEPSATVTPFPAARTDSERDPYPGLSAFTAADADLFFGRETETAAMWRRITSRRLLAVIGPSGVGKSSFLLAGVIPAAPPGWRALICAPGEAPFMALARALVPELEGDAEQVEQLLGFDDPEVALAVLSRWRDRWDEALLVIDQLEELFTLNPPEIRASFVDLILRLVIAARVHVVLVMRDDFLCELHAHPPLAPVFKDLTLLGPPAAGDLRRALVEPARRCGYRFDDEELPDEMVASLTDERGALPLLAFAAHRLWELRDREQQLITRESYEHIGGVTGALAQHAEETLDEIGHERLPIVRELFRNLVTAAGTRSVRKWDELLSIFSNSRSELPQEVLRALIDARLLTSYEVREKEGGSTRRVEIVHESLLREWPRLVRWQTQDADAARLRDQLRQVAQLWDARGRPAELLWTGAPYLEFRAWRESYPGGLTSTEEAFAEAMINNAKRRSRRRRLVAAAVVLAALAVAAVTTTLWHRSEVHARRLEARRLTEISRQTMSRSPPIAFAYALASLEIMDGPEAQRLALQAIQSSPMPIVIGRDRMPGSAIGVDFSPDGRWLSVGHFAGHVSLWPSAGGDPIVWQAHQGAARGYFAPDSGAVLTSCPGDPQYRLWSIPGLERLGSIDKVEKARGDTDARRGNILCHLIQLVPDPSSPLGWRGDLRSLEIINQLAGDRTPAAALSPDGTEMVVALDDELLLYRLDDPIPSGVRIGRAPSDVEFVTYHPGGDRFATAHTDGTLRLWSIRNQTAGPIRTWPRARNGGCSQIRFDPAGDLLAAVFDEGAGVVRRIDDPPAADPLLLLASASRMVELAFHPEGRWIATSNMSRVSLWPINWDRLPTILRGHSAQVERVVFSPDGRWLASYSNDGSVRQWPLDGSAGEEPRILHDWGHTVERLVGWMDLSEDGRSVVTTAGVDSARLVPSDGSPSQTLGGFDQRVLRAAVSPNGRLVAANGRSGDSCVVRVWDLETGTVTDVGLGEGGTSIWDWWADLHFTSDGRLLAAYKDQLLLLDPARGQKTVLAEGKVFQFTSARDGEVVLSRPDVDRLGTTTVRDLKAGTEIKLTSHGSWVTSIALDRTGTIAVTGSRDGIVRVGPVTDEEPHWLIGGPRADVESVTVSPDGRRIASGHSDGTIRLWSMPDLTKPPLHDLPRAEIIARLKSLTNLRVVRNPDDPESYAVKAEPFPGWHTTPEW
jgi:DNA-binding winged helix-turn-helix (wHTH) protein/WD40 repeat protein